MLKFFPEKTSVFPAKGLAVVIKNPQGKLSTDCVKAGPTDKTVKVSGKLFTG
jgi:hypothetical protein